MHHVETASETIQRELKRRSVARKGFFYNVNDQICGVTGGNTEAASAGTAIISNCKVDKSAIT